MHYKWEEYQQFVDSKTLKLEESFGNLCMYYYYDILQLSWMYAVVLNNEILFDTEDYPYDYWNGATAVYSIMNK